MVEAQVAGLMKMPVGFVNICRQTRLRPAWCRPAGTQQRRLPLRHKRLAEIIDLAKNLDDPIQHHRLHH
jgi:hypothetical protein